MRNSFRCPLDFEDLHPVEGGRHCGVCDQVVVDLCGLSPEQARARLAAQPGKACARSWVDRRGRVVLLKASTLLASAAALSAAIVEGLEPDRPQPGQAVRLVETPQIGASPAVEPMHRVEPLDEPLTEELSGEELEELLLVMGYIE